VPNPKAQIQTWGGAGVEKQGGSCKDREILEFTVKSGKHSTRTLSLFQNGVRFKKEPAKKYIRPSRSDG
jgi:hypothetical protein